MSEATRARVCKANPTSDPPQDCDAPFCGCVPAWQDAIAMLQECGWGPIADAVARAGQERDQDPKYLYAGERIPRTAIEVRNTDILDLLDKNREQAAEMARLRAALASERERLLDHLETYCVHASTDRAHCPCLVHNLVRSLTPHPGATP